ncbi:MAG: hypothetical protein K2N94_15980 [Lachnospiraceae bacterium]|nr:hypothetical protein [Lachnospiraceae bacterium]
MILFQILGMLLKILGIALLVLLALALLFLLIVLFVPVRYRAEVERSADGELRVRAKVSYLLNAVRFLLSFEDGKLDFSLKVLWFKLFPGKGGGRRKKEAAEKESAADGENAAGGESITAGTAGVSDTGGTAEADGKNAAGGETGNAVDTAGEADGGVSDTDGGEAAGSENAADGPDGGLSGTDSNADAAGSGEEADAPEQGGFFYRLTAPFRALCRLWKKLLALVERLRSFFGNISESIRRLWEKLKLLRGRAGLIRDFLLEEVNKNAIRCAGKTIFQLLKYVLPYKIKGEVVFGTGDVYSMGQTLSVLGIIYPVYAKNLIVRTDFETERFRLDGYVLLKGRIRFGKLLYMLLRLWIEGKGRLVLKNVKKVKNDLAASAGGK